MLNWNTTKEDFETIIKIVERAESLLKGCVGNRMTNLMDIEACHCNGNPLELQRFLEADDENFAHDFLGIQRHINRRTGQLEDFFVPRFSAHEETDEEALKAIGATYWSSEGLA